MCPRDERLLPDAVRDAALASPSRTAGHRPLGGEIPGVWYHVDYEAYDRPLPDAVLRFHAQWRQERPTTAVGPANVQLHEATNLDGAENYVALEAEGAGQMVGLVLEVDNPHGGWFGEGDDMVFIDGDTWPPVDPRHRNRGDLRRRRVTHASSSPARTPATT